MTNQALPAHPFPDLSLQMLDGTTVQTSEFVGGWTMFMVYRGHHCPRCKSYVAQLQSMAPQFGERGVRLVIGSADPRAVAEQTVAEEGWTLPVFAGLTIPQMRQLGLYITDPVDDDTIPGPYGEPGIFLINPTGALQTLCISNSPSARPDLTVFLDGIIGTQDRNLPVRGLYKG